MSAWRTPERTIFHPNGALPPLKERAEGAVEESTA